MSVVKVSSLAFVAWMVSAGAFAADGEWTVRKSSGEVWTGAQGVHPVSLGQESVLKPGDTVTTGRNGRVLLVRGQETILIAPNSVVGVPVEKKDGLATTITQQAGSILLEVEKKNVPHFEVETPYLAAVVKGTQFRVSVTATGTRVDVQRGQVEVVDFKTGQIAQVLPGQAAQSFAQGAPGLSLTGSGAFRPIEHGAPRVPTLELIKVPKSGITAPAIERGRPGQAATLRGASHASTSGNTAHGAQRHGAVRISAPLGEVRLNVQKATHGLARSASATHNSGKRAAKETTIWNAQDGKSATGPSAIATGDSNGNAAGASGAGASVAGSASGAASVSGVSAATAAVAAGSSGNGNSTGNGGGNSGGNGKGNGNGNGNGNGGGNGNGNNGNGNGNGGGNGNGNAGNGNGHGRGKS